ncbi:Rieske (2Fe-2S) protein [Streptomyces showdoensis]|uniref:Cytochrome bc1 complex Rieske iron-sulfur subunit n=1 Tax=Streptomyces showdoensis TaxID=68268 RepID=A0A2P2GC68_STREW|nr:Rieske (2Fe-2S) protein [Streptomyces showdoensis]KKZ69002.1 iron-sulfur protein [Streptomyces showdoensis]
MSGVGRRTVVSAAGGAGLVAALAACGGGSAGGDGGGGAAGGTGGKGDTGGADASSGADETGGTDASGGTPQTPPLAKTGDIPVGGGKVLADRGVVITQPKAGEFKAFSSRCTHAGCTVASVADGVIVCPCHQSRFDVSDGSVKGGPAPSPLEPTPIEVTGDAIRLG